MSETIFTCAWCQGPLTADANYCKQCGHEAHKPRWQCLCAQCRQHPVHQAAERARLIQSEIDQVLGARRRPNDRN